MTHPSDAHMFRFHPDEITSFLHAGHKHSNPSTFHHAPDNHVGHTKECWNGTEEPKNQNAPYLTEIQKFYEGNLQCNCQNRCNPSMPDPTAGTGKRGNNTDKSTDNGTCKQPRQFMRQSRIFCAKHPKYFTWKQ